MIPKTGPAPTDPWVDRRKFSSSRLNVLLDQPGLRTGDVYCLVRGGPCWTQAYLSRFNLGVVFLSLSNSHQPFVSLLSKFWLLDCDETSPGVFTAVFERTAYGLVTITGTQGEISEQLQELSRTYRRDLGDALTFIFRQFLRQHRQKEKVATISGPKEGN